MFTRLTRPFCAIRQSQPAKITRRHRLEVECLEERTLLNNRYVVPLPVPVDNFNSFHTLSAALTTAGLTAGNFVQIQLGSSPGSIRDADLDAALSATRGNLTIQGEPAAGVA